MLKTALQEAFERLGFTLKPNPHRNPRPMWNANLSFRTYNKLKNEGVMA
jgi:hypothetical protein